MTTELLQGLVDTARAVFGARAVSVALHDEDAGELVFAAVSGEGADTMPGRRVPATAGIAGWVLASGQPLVIEDVTTDPRWASDFARSTGYMPKGIMSAPLLGEDAAVGVMSVLDRPLRSEFSLVEVDLLGRFCHLAVLALQEAPAPEAGPVADLAAALGELPPARRAAAERVVDALSGLLSR